MTPPAHKNDQEGGAAKASPVNLFCPNLKCRSILQVTEKARGKKVRCSQCGTVFMVPGSGSEKPLVKGSPTK